MTDELETILRAHTARYPEMQPTDAVKLIYQNEFGGGHLITDERACMEYLKNEYAHVCFDPALAVCEPIGNGLVRVHLAALRAEDLDALGAAFIRSAAAHHGSMAAFREKLATLEALTTAGIFSFDAAALHEYLTVYEKAGFPAVSHSPEYRRAYRPAYRVVRETERL